MPFGISPAPELFQAKADVVEETDQKALIAIHKKSLGAAPKSLQRMLLTLLFNPGSKLLIMLTLLLLLIGETL